MIRAAFGAVLCALAIISLSACGGSKPAPSTTAAVGAAKPSVQAQELGVGSQAKGIKLNVKGPVDVTFRKITIPPGLGTGLHCHDGNLIAVVKEGTLTHYAPIYPNGVHKYKKGDSIFEGSGYVHQGKNLGDTDVVLMVTYVTPKGDPLSETDLSRCSGS